MSPSLYPIWNMCSIFKISMGESTLSPPQIVVTCIFFLQLIFFGNVWTSHLELSLLVLNILISFRLHLINYFEKFNKHWRFWMYEIYLWQNNTHHRVSNFWIYTSKLGLWMEFFGEFFNGVWYWYTWIKSRKIWKLNFFGWNPIKKMCFFAFV